MNEYMVKGSSIKSKFDFVKAVFKEEKFAKLKNELPAYNNITLLDTSWYPFQMYEDVNKKIADICYGGEISKLQEVGSFSAEQVLTSVYKSYMSGGDFLKFLKRISSLHERFYSAGKMEVIVDQNEKACKIVLSGAPFYTEADNNIALGFYVGSANLCGLKKVKGTITKKIKQVVFDLIWS